jgi:hypothetical protein
MISPVEHRLVGAKAVASRIARAGILLACVLGTGAARADPLLFTKDSIMVFGGRFTDGDAGDTLDAFNVQYERNYVLGAAFRREFLKLDWGFTLGAEIGGAGRFGEFSSGELWFGPVIRYQAPPLGPVIISVAMTFGLSAVTAPIGIERVREISHNGDATLLFYMGPEIAFALRHLPNWELVYRMHHRSGANELLGNMMEGSNANTLGLRYTFAPPKL